jgi:hypothetical protein
MFVVCHNQQLQLVVIFNLQKHEPGYNMVEAGAGLEIAVSNGMYRFTSLVGLPISRVWRASPPV